MTTAPVATYAQKREALCEYYKEGIKPVDGRQPIPEDLAQEMVKNLKDSGVPTDALIGVFDTFLTLTLTLQEHGYNNIVYLENYHTNLTTLQEKYYNTIEKGCEKIGVIYYVPPMNNYNRCDMDFYVTIGNPPYSETSSGSTNNVSLDSKFFQMGVDKSDMVKMIIRAKHFTDPRSTFRRNLFQTGKVSKISYLDSKNFGIYQEIITCIVTYDVNHDGPTVVEYAGDVVKEEYLTKDSLVFLTSPDKKEIPYEESLAARWVRGKIPANKLDHNSDGVQVIVSSGKDKPNMAYDLSGEHVALNRYGIIMNVTNHLGKTGPVRMKQYDACLGGGVLALLTDTQEEAKVLYDFFHSEECKQIIKEVKTSTVSSKQMFSYIEDPIK